MGYKTNTGPWYGDKKRYDNYSGVRVSFLEHNLDILRIRYPEFKKEVQDIYKADDQLIISTSKSGMPTAIVQGKFIHSNHQPEREAERLVDSQIPENISACLVEGFGLGYFVEAILKLRQNIPLILVEPSPERFLKALESRDLESVLSSPRVSLLLGNNSESIRYLLPGLPKGSIQIFKHRALYELDIEYYTEIDSIVKHFISRREVNTATLNKFGELWVRNLIANLDNLPQAGDVGELSGLFADLPVLLLAAGPSLNNIIPYLEQLQKKFIIVAVDTSAAVLMNAGCIPDFTVVVDPQYWNTRHLDRVDLSGTILISESSTHPGIFRKNHSKIFFCGSLFPLGIFMEKYGGQKKKLAAGGSVATSAWDFCRLISRGHLYCGGLDLGFPENKTHFHGSFFEEKVHIQTTRISPPENYAYQYLASGNTFLSFNNKGTKTLTDQRLGVYIKWFEEQIKINKVEDIWNISPHGIKIEGMEYRDLEKLLEYPDNRFNIDKTINNINLKPAVEKSIIKKELLKGTFILESEFNRLINISNKAVELIHTYKNSIKKESLITELIKQLDIIDSQIMISDSSQISSFLLQPIINEIAGKKKAETFNEGIDQSLMLYSKILNTANFHRKLVGSYLKNSPKSAE
jgi:hypothetical protein